MFWRLAIAAFGFASTALAQGSAGPPGQQGGSQSTCAALENQGCYDDTNNGRHVGATWQFVNTTTDYHYYPGLKGGMTRGLCATVCRGHGFRYAVLYGGTNCYCSPEFPVHSVSAGASANAPPTLLSGANSGANAGVASGEGSCSTACAGNVTESCGGSGYATVLRDPTFTSNAATATDPGQYKYIGCFGHVAPGPMFLAVKTSSTMNCATFCGYLGYSFIARNAADSNTGNNCGCGTEVQMGYQIAESSCTFYCNGSISAQWVSWSHNVSG